MDQTKKKRITNSKKVITMDKQEEVVVLQLQKNNAIVKDKILEREFFMQEVVVLAKALIGKIIVRNLPEGQIKAIIVETEAYKAPQDKACHAYNNKKTDRTKYFWQDGGHLYVYNIYGPQNNCINITAGTKDQPEAVLIRAVEPIEGGEIVKVLRKTACKRVIDFTNGPGKSGMALGINKTHNGFDLTKGEECYLIESIQEYQIGVSSRINIDYAEEWKDMPWRFFAQASKYVSKGK